MNDVDAVQKGQTVISFVVSWTEHVCVCLCVHMSYKQLKHNAVKMITTSVLITQMQAEDHEGEERRGHKRSKGLSEVL